VNRWCDWLNLEIISLALSCGIGGKLSTQKLFFCSLYFLRCRLHQSSDSTKETGGQLRRTSSWCWKKLQRHIDTTSVSFQPSNITICGLSLHQLRKHRKPQKPQANICFFFSTRHPQFSWNLWTSHSTNLITFSLHHFSINGKALPFTTQPTILLFALTMG